MFVLIHASAVASLLSQTLAFLIMALKGKQVAGKGSFDAKDKGKRKRDYSGEKEKSAAAARKRKNPGVLKFFDDVAADTNESDDSDEFDFPNRMRLKP